MFTLSLPKTAPVIVGRPRIARWLAARALVPLRLLVAPAGSGKTTSAVSYARARSGTCVYLKVTPAIARHEFIAQLAALAGAHGIDTYDALIECLASVGRLEIIIDDIDGVGTDVRELLHRLYIDSPAQLTWMYLARSSDALELGAAPAQGLVEICDAHMFAFDAAEITSLCALLEHPIAASDADWLLRVTAGWPIAVAGACRVAAADDLPIGRAFAHWRASHGAALHALAPNVLPTLRRDGLLTAALGEVTVAVRERAPQGTIELFGRFAMSFDDRIVEWQRRRDRQIVAYLAMQPDGCATREQLIATFWPEGDPQLARQSLRTAFCTIRRAIGAVTGQANVARYFVAGHIVELKLAHIHVTARRFETLAAQCQEALLHGDRLAALDFFRAADECYRSPFLAGEPPMTWAIEHERRLAALFETISAGIVRGRYFHSAALAHAHAPLDVA